MEWGGNTGRWRDAVKWVQRLGKRGFYWGEEAKKGGAGRVRVCTVAVMGVVLCSDGAAGVGEVGAGWWRE